MPICATRRGQQAGGLKAFTLYNFRFTICGSDKASALGRTKTSPATNDDVSLINLAVFSGSNYLGQLHPINKVKIITDDASQARGYFNAYGNAAHCLGRLYLRGRTHMCRDGSSTLNNTEALFRSDEPAISVDQRKMNAARAYYEWMPIRQVDAGDNSGLIDAIRNDASRHRVLDLVWLGEKQYTSAMGDGASLARARVNENPQLQ
ncbi:hypothetical protein B0T24DRAFT_666378 [Lasiosphaeria ovina]|uniref:PhoD-like phosphatase metallophosphatase domain-containing protein n=1 Tax=Lasiosphaeria ovina TaxID=92902 RepID=A0AAE0N6Z7_9PEZI|nr:hypothetical protein B0T24DRAFT_666378 [Lasiosphaeria ovina]